MATGPAPWACYSALIHMALATRNKLTETSEKTS